MSTAKKPARARSQYSSRTATDEGFLRTFATVAKALSQSLSLEMVLATTLDLTLADPRLEAGEIYLLDENSGELRYACHRGLSEECIQEAKEVPVKLGQGITGHVAAHKEPIAVLELSEEPRFLREMPKKEGYRTLISLPIKSGDRLYGVINLFSSNGHRLPPRYVGWLADCMELPGTAFYYVHLFEEKNARIEELEESEERYHGLIEDINDGYMVLRGERVIFANKRCAEIAGCAFEEMIGQPFNKYLAPESLEQAMEGYQTSMRGDPMPARAETMLLKADGTKAPVELVFKDIIYGGRPAVSAILRDITERRRAEGILQRSKQLEALHAIAASVSHTVDLQDLLTNALAKVIEVMDVEAGGIYLLDVPAREFILQVHAGLAEDFVGEVGTIKLEENELERAMQWHDPTVRLDEAFNEATLAVIMGAVTREELKTFTIVPLWSKGVLQGMLSIASHSERWFTPEDIDLLYAIGNQIAVAIENVSLFQDTKDKAERLSVTAELTRTLVSSLNIEEVFGPVTAGVRRLVDFNRASIALVEGENLRVLAVSSDMDKDVGGGAIVPLKDSAAEWVVQNKRTNTETDFAQSIHFPTDKSLFREGMRSAIRLPLFYRGEVFGIFTFLSCHPDAYGQRELEILGELAGQIAIAIQNDRLFAEVKQRKEELETAYNQLMATATALDRGKRELESAYLNMARTLVLTLEARDPYTRGHSERVAQLARQIAFEMGLSPDEMRNIETAARLHDLGKIGIPDAILLKPGSISPSERAEIQLHPTRAVELLRLLGFLDGVLPIIEGHHERYNGGGYPESRRGEETPLGARILAVADAYDAMTSTRPYRPPMSNEEAMQVLKEGSGKQWDPGVVETFLSTFDK